LPWKPAFFTFIFTAVLKAEKEHLFDFLESRVRKYNCLDFIEEDPILIPHSFSLRQDVEIAGFLAATIAWGRRKMIIQNARKLVELMDNAPYDFILNATEKELRPFKNFTHRTFNGTDCIFFLKSLKNIYKKHGGLENAFCGNENYLSPDLKEAICNFRKIFFSIRHPERTGKHVSDPERNSSAKRLCMFLRWMVREDKSKVDFGLWKKFSAAQLNLPLDVHTGNVGRKLKLLTRSQNDWKAVEEITFALREFDPKDPVKYDFALFGIGVSGEVI
jgi:uncharacterized protein (TIGR02757 family)